MPAIESFRQKEKEAALAKNPESQEIKGPTIKEILANKNQADLFGVYLETEGEEGEALGIKLKTGDASQLGRDEFTALEERRKEFLGILERSKNVVEVLDAKTLKEIIESSSDPNIKALAGVAGPDAMKNAVKNYLPKMAIMDRERFAALSERAVALKETRQAIAEDNKEIKKLCDKYHLDEKEYIEAIQSGDPKELARLVKSRMGGWFKGMRARGRIRELDKADEIRDRIAELESDLKEVGSVLEMSLMENDTLHEALVVEITKEGEAPKLEAGMGFSEVKKLTDEDFKKARESFYQSLKDQGLDPDGIPDERYQQEADKFSRSYLEKAQKGRKGFWAMIWESLSAPKLAETLKR